MFRRLISPCVVIACTLALPALADAPTHVSNGSNGFASSLTGPGINLNGKNLATKNRYRLSSTRIVSRQG
jgi:hypothetical protein